MREGIPTAISTSALLTAVLLAGCGRGVPGGLGQLHGGLRVPSAPTPTANGKCVGGQSIPTVVTDRQHYALGATVTITATVKNISELPCWVPTNNCDPHADPAHPAETSINNSGPNFSITRQSGQYIWYDPKPPGIASPCTVAQGMLRPGQSLSQEWRWSQQVYCNKSDSGFDCAPTGQAGPGSYYVTLRWADSLLGYGFSIE
jgi:hypothetical protein